MKLNAGRARFIDDVIASCTFARAYDAAGAQVTALDTAAPDAAATLQRTGQNQLDNGLGVIDFGDATAPIEIWRVRLATLASGGAEWVELELRDVAHEAISDATADTLTAPGHGLANGDLVMVLPVRDQSLPAGLAQWTGYYARDVSGDTFKVAATAGGAAINLTTAAPCLVAKCYRQVVNSGDPVTIPVGQLVHLEY